MFLGWDTTCILCMYATDIFECIVYGTLVVNCRRRRCRALSVFLSGLDRRQSPGVLRVFGLFLHSDVQGEMRPERAGIAVTWARCVFFCQERYQVRR